MNRLCNIRIPHPNKEQAMRLPLSLLAMRGLSILVAVKEFV